MSERRKTRDERGERLRREGWNVTRMASTGVSMSRKLEPDKISKVLSYARSPVSRLISFHSSLHTRLVTFGSVSLSLLPSRAEPNETGMEWNETRRYATRGERSERTKGERDRSE